LAQGKDFLVFLQFLVQFGLGQYSIIVQYCTMAEGEEERAEERHKCCGRMGAILKREQ
jgi:hypothetical protein